MSTNIEMEQNTLRPSSSKALKDEIAKILEEFLIKDLENRKAKLSTGQRRNKSDPFTERIRLPAAKNGVSRSKTLPDEKLGSSLKSGKELERYISPHIENGFLSSGESDGEQAMDKGYPKKKSRFKKAAAIIGHYLKRNQKRRNKKSDDGADSLAVNDHSRKGSETLSTGRNLRTSERRTSNDSPKSKKNSIFHSFRKSKSAKRDSDVKSASFVPESEVHGKDSDEIIYEILPATVISPKDTTNDKPGAHYASSGAGDRRRSYSRSNSSSPADAEMGHGDLRGSSTSTAYPASDLTSNTAWSSTTSNALDNPGEDIDYMDLDPPGVNTLDGNVRKAFGFTPRKMSMSKFLDSEGIKNLQLLAQAQMEMEMQSKMGGNTFAYGKENHDATDGASSKDKPAETQRQSSKEELYGKIATKLAEIAVNYSTPGSNNDATNSPVKVPLTELEKEIIACIRSEGDRNSAAIEEKFEAFAAHMAEESYNKFKSTIRSSVSQELSWDHLAFVFYTTKAVVSAVGKGTKTATKMKEYTLEYISDTFATWIIDQGGFDSIMSGSESDFDVD